jgi:hypothetical protein
MLCCTWCVKRPPVHVKQNPRRNVGGTIPLAIWRAVWLRWPVESGGFDSAWQVSGFNCDDDDGAN